MTNSTLIIQEGMNFDDLEHILHDVSRGELIGVHSREKSIGVHKSVSDLLQEFFRIGSYHHLDPGNPRNENDGPNLHLSELLQITIPTNPVELKWGKSRIALPKGPIFDNFGAMYLNFGTDTYVGGSLLIGKETISDKLENEGFGYVAEIVRNFELS